MVYKWTMAMQFSFEYCIDPKDHKSEESPQTRTIWDTPFGSGIEAVKKLELMHLGNQRGRD